VAFAMSSATACARVSGVSGAAPSRRAGRRTVARAQLQGKERIGGGLILADERSLKYLDGTLPGDYGFDPLGLVQFEDNPGFIGRKWLVHAEVMHCRWAMLGAAGCFAPEFLGKVGLIPEATAVPWFQSGVIPPLGTIDYWTDAQSLFWVELIAMSFAEHRRIQDYNKPGSMGEQNFIGLQNVLGGSGNPNYPGGQFFDMFGLSENPEEFKKMQVKEIKNGRLAMVAMLGYFLQAVVTGKGPVDNLIDHLADPTGSNFLANLSSIGGP